MSKWARFSQLTVDDLRKQGFKIVEDGNMPRRNNRIVEDKPKGKKFFESTRTEVEPGEKLDSKAQAKRYWELKLLQDAGEIHDLHFKKTDPALKFHLGRDYAGRDVYYSADFVYYLKDDPFTLIVEEFKTGRINKAAHDKKYFERGIKANCTDDSKLRMMLFKALYPLHKLRVVVRYGSEVVEWWP